MNYLMDNSGKRRTSSGRQRREGLQRFTPLCIAAVASAAQMVAARAVDDAVTSGSITDLSPVGRLASGVGRRAGRRINWDDGFGSPRMAIDLYAMENAKPI
jgi:hypothetical protein